VGDGNYTLKEWQASGHDHGTTTQPLPTDDELRALIRATLNEHIHH
jgi:hypothetical protein